MASPTIQAYVDIALGLVAKASSTYLAIGKSTAWENEKIPPMAVDTTLNIQEIIGFKKMSTVSLCKPLGATETTAYTEVTYNGTRWALIPTAKATEEGAYHVYFSASLTGTELPPGEYRQVGIYVGLTTASSKTALLPSEITSRGTLQFYDNRQRFNRTDKVSVTERFIVSMKSE